MRFVILAEQAFGPLTSKTANAFIRYTPEKVLAVIDSARAGRTAEQVLGFGGDIPVVATLDEALATRPDALLIGIAPPGGRLEGARSSRAPSRPGSSCGAGCTSSSPTTPSSGRSRSARGSASTTCASRPRTWTSRAAGCARWTPPTR
jgi:hypothetical protein